jgi:predicted kinase
MIQRRAWIITMIIHINGHPGVGKFTVGRIVADELGGRLLDNHSIYNVAFALTEFKSATFHDTVRAVRAIAYQRILDLPGNVPVVLTNADMQDSAWGNECWDAAIELARTRGSELVVVILDCTVEENTRRIQSSGREAQRKPRDPHVLRGKAEGRVPIDRGGERLLRLDTTSLSAKASAERILAWLAR